MGTVPGLETVAITGKMAASSGRGCNAPETSCATMLCNSASKNMWVCSFLRWAVVMAAVSVAAQGIAEMFGSRMVVRMVGWNKTEANSGKSRAHL